MPLPTKFALKLKKDVMSVNPGHNRITWFIKLWLPPLAWMGFIFYLSSIPGRDIPLLFPYQDILFHTVIYAILAYFFTRALKNTYPGLVSPKVIYITVIFGVIYGFTDEFHQVFVPHRYASGLDLFIDGVGSFMGSLFYRWPK